MALSNTMHRVPCGLNRLQLQAVQQQSCPILQQWPVTLCMYLLQAPMASALPCCDSTGAPVLIFIWQHLSRDKLMLW